jgi:hypothetical protein
VETEQFGGESCGVFDDDSVFKSIPRIERSDRRLTDKIYTDENLLGTWAAFDALPNFAERPHK